MEDYQQFLSQLSKNAKQLKIKDRHISIIRLLCISSAIVLAYQYIKQPDFIWIIGTLLALVAFGLVINYHLAIRWKIRFREEKNCP